MIQKRRKMGCLTGRASTANNLIHYSMLCVSYVIYRTTRRCSDELTRVVCWDKPGIEDASAIHQPYVKGSSVFQARSTQENSG